MGRMRARPKVDEARDILANVVVCHVPVVHYNFQQKVQLASIAMLLHVVVGTCQAIMLLSQQYAWRRMTGSCPTVAQLL